jgi:serine/threonine-protein kinase
VLFELLTGRPPFTGETPLSVAYQHVNSGVPAPSSAVPGIPAAVDQLVLAATSRDPALRPADAGEFARAVRRVREDMGEPSGLTGVMGAGVQGLAEAPWLNLDTPAVTNGWWARSSADGLGGGQTGADDWGRHEATPPPASEFRTDGFDTNNVGSHTLVVHREDGGRYLSGREPFLQRWLFSPRLGVIALILVLGIGLGVGGWWLTTGRYSAIPVVTGDSVGTATTALTMNGFTVARTIPVNSNTEPKGTVTGTNPSGRATKGSSITILVSAGPFTSTVPHVRGDTVQAAEAALQRVHLSPTVQRVGSNSPLGTVLGTSPKAGTTWPQTKTVVIQVAGGPPLPDFKGMTIDEAKQWAQAHGVSLNTVQNQNSTLPQGTILGQQPAAGSLYQQGETVTVTVSAQPAEVPVPDVQGMTVGQATRNLEAAGFQVQVNPYAFGFGYGNRVFEFAPSTVAPRGSVITLYTT